MTAGIISSETFWNPHPTIFVFFSGKNTQVSEHTGSLLYNKNNNDDIC